MTLATRPGRTRPQEPALPRDEPVSQLATWGFRVRAVGLLVLAFALLRIGRPYLFGDGREPIFAWERAAVLGSLGWAVAIIPASVSVIGLLLFRGIPRQRKEGGDEPPPTVARVGYEVCYRIVSRGQNAEALQSTVDNIRNTMIRYPLFRWRIETVVDEPVDLAPYPELQQIVVPPEYTTPADSRYKARALHYALVTSPVPDDSWLLHLDEESHITPSLVAGVRDAVLEEERTGQLRIGQGAILYHRHLRRHPFLTLADSLRTGDDVSRFYVQARAGVPMFGMHGSFILVRNDIAKDVGFDVGPEGSVTEDACWALQQASRGRHIRWVDGFVVEQSTESIADFVKQRRRWFAGLWLVVLYADVKLWLRLVLTLFITVWAITWLGALYTYTNLVTGLETHPTVALLGDLGFSYYITAYTLGLWINLRNRSDVGRAATAVLYVAQVVAIPVFGLLEAAGVLLAMFRPERGFHVVKKSAPSDGARAREAAQLASAAAAAAAAAAARTVSSTSASEWERLGNSASYGPGANATPASSIEPKKTG